MCCCGNVTSSSPEYNKRFKPESNSGCCSNKGPDNCDQPSRVAQGSVSWDWEQEHGRIINKISEEIGNDGRWHFVFSKTICPKKEKLIKNGCCSLKYKVIR